MVSAAESLASSFTPAAFAKATELQKRILFTLGALIVYRVGTYLPLPGLDHAAFRELFGNQESGLGSILGMANLLAGGAIERMSVFALAIMPYISASIIVQLLTAVSPTLEALKKEGEAGRKKLNQYTRYGTVVLSLVQSFGIAMGFQQPATAGGAPLAADPGLFFTVSTVATLTGGTIFLMWLGEQVTSRGIGNGISLIIFAGIVAELPRAIGQLLSAGWSGTAGAEPINPLVLIFMLLLMGVTVIGIVFFERAQRRLLIQYPKQQQGNRMVQNQATHLPLKVNTAGVIPPIFASSILLLPLTVLSFTGGAAQGGWLSDVSNALSHGQPLYMLLYAVGIIFFCFFYTAIVFNPQETADNLRKWGNGFIPGYKPGANTATYLDYVLTRVTVVGAAYLTVVCLVPEFLISAQNLPLQFSAFLGGTSLMIVVTVTMDTVAQIHSHLLAQQYEGRLKAARLKGKKGARSGTAAQARPATARGASAGRNVDVRK